MHRTSAWLANCETGKSVGLPEQSVYVLGNIETETLQNTEYRRVLTTTDQMQLVVMSLEPGEDIPAETHENKSQFFRVEAGTAIFVVEGNTSIVEKDGIVVVPGGARHYVQNASNTEPLKIYIVYAPAEHAPDRRDERQPTGNDE